MPKVNRTISLDPETDEYARSTIPNLSQWVRECLREAMSRHRGFMEEKDAHKALRIRAESEKAWTAYISTYGVDPDKRLHEIEIEKNKREAEGEKTRRERIEARYSEVWDHIRNRSDSQARDWLSRRGSEFGLKGSPQDMFLEVSSWAERHDKSGGQRP